MLLPCVGGGALSCWLAASASPRQNMRRCCFTQPTNQPPQPEAYVSKLVIVPGIVTASSRPKHKATYLTLQCKECK